MKKYIKAAALLSAFALAACSATEDNAFVIGGIGPLTGNAAVYGLSVRRGAEIAVEEINKNAEQNGYTLKLHFEDDECDEEKSINAYNKLMDKKIDVLMGPVTSGCCIAVGGTAKNDGILQLTPSGSADDCTKYDNQFRICFTDSMQGEIMAEYIYDKGYEKIGIIYDNSDEYSSGITDAFTAKYKELGGSVAASESFKSGDVDFKTQLTKMSAAGAAALFLPIYYTEAGYITEQAAAAGYSPDFYGCDGWDGIIKQLGGDTKNIEGAVFLTPFVPTAEREVVRSFVAAYTEKHSEAPNQFAADGYDAVYTIKALIDSEGVTADSAALIAAMTKISVDGVTGRMTFDENGEPDKAVVYAMIQSGAYVELSE